MQTGGRAAATGWWWISRWMDIGRGSNQEKEKSTSVSAIEFVAALAAAVVMVIIIIILLSPQPLNPRSIQDKPEEIRPSVRQCIRTPARPLNRA